MEASWKQGDTFPIIVRLIQQAHREQPRFITTREIIECLLQDAEGQHFIEMARGQQKDKKSSEWLATNMVSWFSQRITVGASEWARAFERTKIDGRWAYRPIALGHPVDKGT